MLFHSIYIPVPILDSYRCMDTKQLLIDDGKVNALIFDLFNSLQIVGICGHLHISLSLSSGTLILYM